MGGIDYLKGIDLDVRFRVLENVLEHFQRQDLFALHSGCPIVCRSHSGCCCCCRLRNSHFRGFECFVTCASLGPLHLLEARETSWSVPGKISVNFLLITLHFSVYGVRFPRLLIDFARTCVFSALLCASSSSFIVFFRPFVLSSSRYVFSTLCLHYATI